MVKALRVHWDQCTEQKWGNCYPDLTVLFEEKVLGHWPNLSDLRGEFLYCKMRVRTRLTSYLAVTQWLCWQQQSVVLDCPGSPESNVLSSRKSHMASSSSLCTNLWWKGMYPQYPRAWCWGGMLENAKWQAVSSPSTGPHSARSPEFPLWENLPECSKCCRVSWLEGHLFTDQANT